MQAPSRSAREYVLLYEPVTICVLRLAPRVAIMEPKSPPRAPRARPLTCSATHNADATHLFVVERRLPGITERGLAMLQAALIEATSRFAARGEQVTYLGSSFLPGQDRLFSRFSAVSLELVRATNEASLVPYVSIQRAVDLPGPRESQWE